MAPVSILLNLLWILIGGAWMAFGWLVASVIMAITIVGLPWARAAFNIAVYTLLPFGSRAVRRDEVTGAGDIGTGVLGVLGNIIWFVLAGWWLALGHLTTGVLMCLTIIGIPLGLANFKLIPVSLTPFGREILDVDQARRLGLAADIAVPGDPRHR
jgi:uncharacterized membrane protein YccF (DUF307 family)